MSFPLAQVLTLSFVFHHRKPLKVFLLLIMLPDLTFSTLHLNYTLTGNVLICWLVMIHATDFIDFTLICLFTSFQVFFSYWILVNNRQCRRPIGIGVFFPQNESRFLFLLTNYKTTVWLHPVTWETDWWLRGWPHWVLWEQKVQFCVWPTAGPSLIVWTTTVVHLCFYPSWNEQE